METTRDNGEDGYRTGYKFSTSTGTESAQSSSPACVSGYIPISSSKDTIRIKNIDVGSVATISNIGYFNANKEYLKGVPGTANCFGYNLVADENGIYSFTSERWFTSEEISGVSFFRFSCAEITDKTIVTVNQEIV